MKRFLFSAALIVADILGFNLIFRRLNAGRIRVLMYHGVTDTKLPSVYWLMVPAAEFRRQMSYLKPHYRVMPVSVLGDEDPRGVGKDRYTAIITFDDGLKNVYTTAWPILKELELRAVCFVVPGLSIQREQIWSNRLFEFFLKTAHTHIDLTSLELEQYQLEASLEQRAAVAAKIIRKLKFSQRHMIEVVLNYLTSHYGSSTVDTGSPFVLMTADQIRTLAASREFDIAAHSWRHCILPTLTAAQQREEISRSISQLADWRIPPCPVFSYPSGHADNITVSILKELQVSAAVAADEGLHADGDDPYRIRRISIGSDTSYWEFKARLSGLYYFLMKLTGKWRRNGW
ncbi:MAG TPA: polysaccharide deacetylase family protein [Candidatus Deferrimicrobium sp.]|nr:polysaccharide deacetylase family protein [Candidatus Deferrimicrobium sp.]